MISTTFSWRRFCLRGLMLPCIALALPSEAGVHNQAFTFANNTTSLGGNTHLRTTDDAGVTVGGTFASVQSNRLRLSQLSIQNRRSVYGLPDLDPTRTISAFTATFEVGFNGFDPGEGLSFNFGAFDPTTRLPTGEEGYSLSEGMFISFDTRINAPLETVRTIDVVVNGLALVTKTEAEFGGYDFTGAMRPVVVTWDANGLDVTYNGFVICDNLAVPEFVPKAGDRFAFSARNSTATQDAYIDTLVVTTTQEPPLETGGPTISEFVVDNEDGRLDEDCDSSAWLEIYNGQNAASNLTGWFLTDDPGNLTKWPIPAINMIAYSYSTIWADGKNRATGPNYHTNFTLNPEGGYLALVRPNSTIATAFNYGPQSEDVSYGVRGAAQTPGYLETPTAGSRNQGVQAAGPPLTEDVLFSNDGGLISPPTPPAPPTALNVAAPGTVGAVVRYTTDNSVPHSASAIWPAGGLSITTSSNIRARLTAPGHLPGPVSSRSFILVDATLTNYRGTGQPFSSNLPIIVFHSYGTTIDNAGGSPGNRLFRYTYGVAIDADPSTANRASILGPVDFQGRGGTHVRGETSAGFPQRPYSWELWDNRDGDKDAAILGLSADSDWALISNYNDKSLLRNKIPFDTMYDLNGEGSAMREKYVEVFFRQDSATGPIRAADYRGVYCLTERIKRHDDRVNITRLDACEGVYTGNPAVDDVSPISGGYIFRKDKDPQINPFTIGGYGGFQVYEPDPPSAAQLNYIRNYTTRLDTALNGASFADPVNGYAKYIDVQSFIDVHLWVEIYKQVDGYRLSSYFYKDRGEKIRSAPLWDYNLCIGNGGPPDYPVDYERTSGWYYTSTTGGAYPFYDRLFQDPAFLLKYWDRYWELRRSMFSNEAIIARIDSMVNELSDNSPAALVTNGNGAWPNPSSENPAARHNNRWQRLGVKDWPNPTGFGFRTRWNSPVDPATVTNATDPFTAVSEIAFCKIWMLRRLMWMDEQSMSYRNTVRSQQAPAFSQYGGVVPSGYQLSMTNPNLSGVLYYTVDGTDPMAGGGTVYSTKTVTPLDIVAEGAPVTYLVPRPANGGDLLTRTQGDPNQWTGLAAPPNAASWSTGPMGVGFDYTATNPDYTPYISTNVLSQMQPAAPAASPDDNATIYLRIPFSMTADQINNSTALRLRARYEDAYIAYLNGVEIVRKTVNASFNPMWNSASASSRSDSSSIIYENVDLAPFKHLLQANNVLAVHAMNSVASGTLTAGKDFLFSAKIEVDRTDEVGGTPIALNNTTQVKARVQIGGLWGPLTDANFIVNAVPASAANIVVSEMHYNPLDPTAAEVTAGANNANDFEFIEIMNISGNSVDLSNCRFTEGVTFNWFDAPAAVQILAPGQCIVICENLAAFNLRHGGSGALVAGTFVGNLANGGEPIRLVAANGADIKFFTFDDVAPWPKDADGGEYDNSVPPVLIAGGYSLVLRNPMSNPDHNVGTNWRSSSQLHGSPGGLDYLPFVGSPNADTDGDGSLDLVEYAAGSNPNDGKQRAMTSLGSAEHIVNEIPNMYLTLSFVRSLTAGNVNVVPELTSNLTDWQGWAVALTYVGSHNNGDGTETITWRSTQPLNAVPSRLLARLRVIQP